MKVTVNHEGEFKEEIDSACLGKFFGRVIWDLLKIVTSVALALWVIWLVVPAPRGLFLLYAPQVCGVLYALRNHG